MSYFQAGEPEWFEAAVNCFLVLAENGDKGTFRFRIRKNKKSNSKKASASPPTGISFIHKSNPKKCQNTSIALIVKTDSDTIKYDK